MFACHYLGLTPNSSSTHGQNYTGSKATLFTNELVCLFLWPSNLLSIYPGLCRQNPPLPSAAFPFSPWTVGVAPFSILSRPLSAARAPSAGRRGCPAEGRCPHLCWEGYDLPYFFIVIAFFTTAHIHVFFSTYLPLHL